MFKIVCSILNNKIVQYTQKSASFIFITHQITKQHYVIVSLVSNKSFKHAVELLSGRMPRHSAILTPLGDNGPLSGRRCSLFSINVNTDNLGNSRHNRGELFVRV